MAISKIIYQASASATPEVWMDATTATATASDIIAPKTAMLADGVMTTGTGSGGGGTEVAEKDVNFIDYDGTIVYSYTTEDFMNLTSLPENPSHTGLTAQGWNWSLEGARQYVVANKKLLIGQMYVTTSGNTEIDIELDKYRLSPFLGIAVDGSVEVDWGDNSTHSTVTGSSLSTQIRTQHNYDGPGEYTITITVTSGNFALFGTSTYSLLSKDVSTNKENYVYAAAVKNIRLGNNAFIGNYGAFRCFNLESITIPQSIEAIGNSAFQSCSNLQTVVLPNNTANSFLYVYTGAFEYVYSLQNISIPERFGVSTSYSYIFAENNTLRQICVNGSIVENNMFQSCSSLSCIMLPINNTTVRGNAFNGAAGLKKIYFRSITPPTVQASSAFTAIATDCEICVPLSTDHSILTSYQTTTNMPSSTTYTYVETPITFAIGNYIYEGEVGMTWTQWCASPYNIDGWQCNSSKVYNNTIASGKVVSATGVAGDVATESDLIVAYQLYVLMEE